MQRHYCTLFDQNYLIKGLAMIRSLERHSPGFTLHVLCMDDVTRDVLRALKIAGVVLIEMADFEDPELLGVKSQRSRAEYCWTCTPSLLVHVINANPEIDLLTYLDADLLFFSSPEPVYQEVGPGSVAIIEHRFSIGFEHYAINGRFNVQWVTIRRDASGLEVAQWWRDRCIEWCSAVSDGERMGDQKYLDCWPDKFDGVHVIEHIGAGVAPWNFASYSFSEIDEAVFVNELPVIFFHYHGYKMLDDGGCTPMPRVYMETRRVPYALYEPYRRALWNSLAEIRTIVPNFTCGLFEAKPLSSVTVMPTSPPDTASIFALFGRLFRRLVGNRDR